MLELQIFRYEKDYFYRCFFLSVVEDRTADTNWERPFLRYNFSFAWSLITLYLHVYVTEIMSTYIIQYLIQLPIHNLSHYIEQIIYKY